MTTRAPRHPTSCPSAITDALLADGLHDDVALVMTRVLPGPLTRTVPALPRELSDMRREITTWATATSLSADLLADLQLALGEAATNTVDHAYPDGPGDLTYQVVATADGVHVTVRDHSRWRPEPADKGNRRRGFQIRPRLAAQASIDHDDTGTTVNFPPDPHSGHRPTLDTVPLLTWVSPPGSAHDVGLSEDDHDGSLQLVRLSDCGNMARPSG